MPAPCPNGEPAPCPNGEPAVTVEPGRVATVRINRPEKRNALRARMP